MKAPTNDQVREAPYLTLNGVVRYMTSTTAKQREDTLLDYKRPDPEGKARGTYYQPARDAIRAFHAAGNDPGIIEAVVSELEERLPTLTNSAYAKVENNIRVLRAYPAAFGRRLLQPVEWEAATITIEGVRISLRPDLLAREGKRTRAIRFAFVKDAPSNEEVVCSVQLLLRWAEATGSPCGPADCLLLSIADGTAVPATGRRRSFDAQLRGAMREVARQWPAV
ncbi:MAG: hypothetical protein GX446_06660 [Chthonomonadales bacterium]|nr:hypothetical protein [Chthonomonadales bacterium]